MEQPVWHIQVQRQHGHQFTSCISFTLDLQAYQAGLPLEKIYRVSEPPPEDESDRRHYICIHPEDTSSEIWLKKVLSFEESDLIATRNKWMQWVHSNPDAAEIYHNMKELVSQIHDAIDRYGLYSELSI